jgi:transcriptional regulator with XRE-family HTH domain
LVRSCQNGEVTTALGEKLRAEREKKDWGLREVERQTGIHNAHLSQIEKGQIERPEPSILWRLAGAYETDFNELMRLAGHLGERLEVGGKYAAAALRVMGDLSPTEQRDVLKLLREWQRERKRIKSEGS